MSGAPDLAVSPLELFEPLHKKLSPGPGRSASDVGDHQRARVHRAMVQIVAERGYKAVTVRDLVRAAGISTRAFYQHFSGKEECFLRTHELIVRRMLRRLASSQAGVSDWRARVRLAFDAFVHELAGDSRVARLLLVEAYTAGPAALEQAQRANRMFGSRIGESFASAPDGIVVSPLVVEGMVAGVASVARAWLLSGRVEELTGFSDDLADWALSYPNEAAAGFARIDRIRLGAHLRQVPANNGGGEEGGAAAPSGDLSLLLSAVAKLAAADPVASLTVPRILAAAGVPRRSFYAHFESADDCLAAALELQVDRALARAKSVRASSSNWADGTYRAITTLCSEVGGSALARACTYWHIGVSLSGAGCRERLVAEIAQLLKDGAPPASRIDDLTAEAAAGAMLGVLWRQAYPAGMRQAKHDVSAALPFLALAPAIGAEQTLEIISEHAA